MFVSFGVRSGIPIRTLAHCIPYWHIKESIYLPLFSDPCGIPSDTFINGNKISWFINHVSWCLICYDNVWITAMGVSIINQTYLKRDRWMASFEMCHIKYVYFHHIKSLYRSPCHFVRDYKLTYHADFSLSSFILKYELIKHIKCPFFNMQNFSVLQNWYSNILLFFPGYCHNS